MNLFRKKSIDKIVQDAELGLSDGHSSNGLKRVLGVKDLTFMGIAAVVGAGIFSTIGTAAFHGGPGISLLFVVTAITCGFSALCYAEFASRVPIAGSAYTYAYVTFGELIAWIIGWALILEYAIGNIVVAISWSGYFVNLLEGFHIHLPGWLSTNYDQAQQGYEEAVKHLAAGGTKETFSKLARIGYDAINNAPMIGSSQPIFLFILSVLFLKEKPRKRVFWGILISFIGVLAIIISPLLFNHGTSTIQKETALEGNIFLMIATLGSVLQAIINKKVLKEVNHYVVSCISFLFGSLTFIPMMIPELQHWSFSALNINGWMGIIFGVFFSSALAYGLYMYGISKISAQEVGIFSYIDPVIAVILAIPLLGEYPTPIFFVGSLCIFLGIILAEGRLHWHPLHKLKLKT